MNESSRSSRAFSVGGLRLAPANLAILRASAFVLALAACGSTEDSQVCSEAGARMVACGLALPAKYVCLPGSAFDECWAACVADASCEDLSLTLCAGAETAVLECSASCTQLPGKCSEPEWSEHCRSLSCREPGEAQTCWWSRGPDGPASCGR